MSTVMSPPMSGESAQPDDFLKIGNLLCFALYSASHAFNRTYKPLLDKLGLTYPQYLVLVTLWEEDGQTVGGLGARLHLESSTLTPLLKRLEGMGHVVRRRDREDERQVRVNLSEQGWALKSAAAGIPMCVGEATGLDIDTMRRLHSEISSLRDVLEKGTNRAA